MSSEFFEIAKVNSESLYTDKVLRDATSKITKYGTAIRDNWFAIAYQVARVNAGKHYEKDGFKTIHDWTKSAFNLKKSTSYALLKIGKEYTREITDGKKTLGYGTNLVPEGSETDFNKTQVERLLPLGHETAVEMVESGEITPEMTAQEIAKTVKAKLEPDTESETDTDTESETEPETDTESPVEKVEVFDAEGNRYLIPRAILEEYKA